MGVQTRDPSGRPGTSTAAVKAEFLRVTRDMEFHIRE
jgi:hypothetical protein